MTPGTDQHNHPREGFVLVALAALVDEIEAVIAFIRQQQEANGFETYPPA